MIAEMTADAAATEMAVQISHQRVDIAKCVVVDVHLMEVSKRSGDTSMRPPEAQLGCANYLYKYEQYMCI